MDKVYIGTELKFKVVIESTGFSMVDDDFTIKLRNGSRVLVFDKSDLVKDENDDFYLCFNTNDIGVGTIEMIVTAHVPDEDFDDGIRDEVEKLKLIAINNL